LHIGFLDPTTAIVVSFCLLGVMIYRRVNIGITLNVTALLLAFLTLDWYEVMLLVSRTSLDVGVISVVLATFGIMIMSQFYKETRLIDDLSESLSRIVRNPKLLVSLLPAIIGLLPVAGGALMSAPLVETETDKLGLKAEKKTYVNFWFRHTIFPVYPVSQVLILAATLTGLTVNAIIFRQIPVVLSMIAAGYIIGLWKAEFKPEDNGNLTRSLSSEVRRFARAFSPILATIAVVVGLSIDVSLAAILGVIVLLLISRPAFEVFKKPFLNPATYGITIAAYGAFLLRNVVETSGFSEVFGTLAAGGWIDDVLLLIAVPTVLGFLVGSPFGAVAISFSILDGVVDFTPRSAALLYIGSYLGYVAAPTHLCLVLTAEYFKCSLGKVYKYIIPSLSAALAVAIMVYLLI